VIRSAIGAELQSLIDYLNAHYPTEKDVVIVVLPGYDAVDDGQGGRGWACYDPITCVIWLPGEMPQLDEMSDDEIRRVYYEHVVHEYIHHIQNCEGRDFDEDEAERRAREIVQAWLDEFALLDGEKGGGEA